MKRSTLVKISTFVFVPAVSACGITDIAGDVDGGSVGGQNSLGGNTSTDVGGAGEVTGIGGAPSTNCGAASGTLRPCDMLQSCGYPCVAAHSTVRLLVGGYTGPLYQVQRASDKDLTDIGVSDGYADAAAQDDFCTATSCTITTIYDQSGNGNDLTPGPPGGNNPMPDKPASATDLKTIINGRTVYGLRLKQGMGYRKLVGNGTARDDEPQTIYMVTSSNDLVNGCCFDYGNAETSANDDGNGAAEAVYFGRGVIWGTGSGTGPWVMADLENGLYAGWEGKQDRNISTNTSLTYDFITAVLVGDTADKNAGKGRFALYGGDATSGVPKPMYDGIRPEKPGYVPMRKQGSIVLGTAGDNTASGAGLFYEGAIANGAAAPQAVASLHISIVTARYGQSSSAACLPAGDICFVNDECCSMLCDSTTLTCASTTP